MSLFFCFNRIMYIHRNPWNSFMFFFVWAVKREAALMALWGLPALLAIQASGKVSWGTNWKQSRCSTKWLHQAQAPR